MKIIRTFTFLWLMAFGSTALASVVISTFQNEVVYDVKVEGVRTNQTLINSETFQDVKLVGVGEYAAIDYQLGQPELPVVRLVVDGDVDVEVGRGSIKGDLGPNLKIKPSQPSWNKSSSKPPELLFDADAYALDSFKERPRFDIKDVGSYRGVRRKMVTLNVMDYNPVRGHYNIFTDFKVTVKRNPTPRNQKSVLALIIGQKFDQSPGIAKLRAIKQSQGYDVKEFVVGRDLLNSPVSIRNTLRSVYQEEAGLEFAIIVGDVDDVASHRSEHIYGVTDHFFRCLDTEDYEADINAPDIAVGRLSVSNDIELDVVVEKIDRYFKGEFTTNSRNPEQDAWLRYPAFIATHDRYQIAEATHNSVIAEYFAPANYSREFPDSSGLGGDKLFPVSLSATRQQIFNSLQHGRFIVNFSGHGSHSGWEDVSAGDVLRLNHSSALPWVLSNSCITGDFRQEPVFAETWLRHRNGAIVFWGSMDSTYWDEDDVLEKALYREVFKGQTRSFDLLHQKALGEVWRYYGGANRSAYYWETYVTFGDPSLAVRLDRAKKVDLRGPDRVIRGQGVGTWTVSEGGVPVAGATIVLIRPLDNLMLSSKTDERGIVRLDISRISDREGALRLVVHGPDLRSVEQNLVIEAPVNP